MSDDYEIDIDTGLLNQARYLPSPNCDERPEEHALDLIVIHGISLPPGKFGGNYIDQLFTNVLDPAEHPYFEEIADLKVSSHLLIRRDGEVVQYVPFTLRAWHAGVSCIDGRERCNDYSIGIELEGEDVTPYTEEQYQSLKMVTESLLAAYPGLNKDKIAGHCDISPGRKTDPGPAFDWSYFRQLLSS